MAKPAGQQLSKCAILCRHRHRHREQRTGFLAARNAALDFARKLSIDYLVFLDDDDALTPDALAVADHTIREHPTYKWFLAEAIERTTRRELADYQVDFRVPLMDLSQLSDDEITGMPVLQSTLRLLKYSRS